VLTALRGAVGFLTRLPVGGGEAAWDAFQATPATFPLVGALVGLLAGVPLLVPAPLATPAALYLLTLYLLTGPTHADGLADLADAASVHGDAETRRAVARDSQTGVGGTLAVALVLVALGLGALSLVGTGGGGLGGLTGAATTLSLVVASEVGAKTGMATLVCRGDPSHDGLGSQFVDEAGPGSLLPVALAALPVVVLAPALARPAVVAALLAAVVVALLVGRFATRRLGGVSGDVLGAANELGRVVAVHAGVVVWTLT
jgi:adenosylcobinamide-GDP ribazoletransferase